MTVEDLINTTGFCKTLSICFSKSKKDSERIIISFAIHKVREGGLPLLKIYFEDIYTMYEKWYWVLSQH